MLLTSGTRSVCSSRPRTVQLQSIPVDVPELLLEVRDLRHDRTRECLRRGQLLDVALRNLLLLGVGVEDRPAVLGAVVGSLSIELRWIVHDREEDLQQLAVRYLRRIVDHLY